MKLFVYWKYIFTTTFLFFLLLQTCTLFGQAVPYWKKNFRAGLNFNQASFSDNWQGGGVNSIGLNTFLSYEGNYARGLNTWDNTVDIAYGIVKNEGQERRKTSDRIFLDTKYGRKLTDDWGLYTSLSFLSQFDKGYEYDVEDPNTGEVRDVLISNFLSPAFITSSWGIEYTPVDYFSVRFGPFSPRATIVTDENVAVNGEVDGVPARYGVPVGEKVRYEWLAFQLVAEFNRDIAENLNLRWNYMLFANYQELEFRKVDHRLDVQLTANVNRFINVSLSGMMIYDINQDNDVQYSQGLNLGIIYTFKNFVEEEEEE